MTALEMRMINEEKILFFVGILVRASMRQILQIFVTISVCFDPVLCRPQHFGVNKDRAIFLTSQKGCLNYCRIV